MITMTITAQDIDDARVVIDQAVERGELDADQTRTLYSAVSACAVRIGQAVNVSDMLTRQLTARSTSPARRRVRRPTRRAIEPPVDR